MRNETGETSTGDGRAVRAYTIVFAVLLCLTILTVIVAFLDLGRFNTPAALFIASVKATLVMIFFMHLGRAGRSVSIGLGSGLFLLTVLVGACLSDLFTQGR